MKMPRLLPAPALALFLSGLLFLAGCEAKKPPVWQGYVEGEFVYVAGKIAGRLDALSVARGDTVVAGQALYALEDGYEDRSLALAEADLRQAESDLRDKEKG